MRALGYPRPISMQSCRTPNVPLVADILLWLVKRLTTLRIDLTLNYSVKSGVFHRPLFLTLSLQWIFQRTSAQRQTVIFIKAVAEFMGTLSSRSAVEHLLFGLTFCCACRQIELNTKNVYKADGYVAKEMLKVTWLRSRNGVTMTGTQMGTVAAAMTSSFWRLDLVFLLGRGARFVVPAFLRAAYFHWYSTLFYASLVFKSPLWPEAPFPVAKRNRKQRFVQDQRLALTLVLRSVFNETAIQSSDTVVLQCENNRHL